MALRRSSVQSLFILIFNKWESEYRIVEDNTGEKKRAEGERGSVKEYKTKYNKQ